MDLLSLYLFFYVCMWVLVGLYVCMCTCVSVRLCVYMHVGLQVFDDCVRVNACWYVFTVCVCLCIMYMSVCLC